MISAEFPFSDDGKETEEMRKDEQEEESEKDGVAECMFQALVLLLLWFALTLPF